MKIPPVCRVITDTPLGYLVWRRMYDDFVIGIWETEGFRLSAWHPEAWRATKFTESQARYVASLLRAEICPIFDRGNKYEVLFSEDECYEWDESVLDDIFSGEPSAVQGFQDNHIK